MPRDAADLLAPAVGASIDYPHTGLTDTSARLIDYPNIGLTDTSAG